METKVTNTKYSEKLRWIVLVCVAVVLAGGSWAFIHHQLRKGKVDKQVIVSDPRVLRIDIVSPIDSPETESAPLLRQEITQSSEKLNSLIRITPQVRGNWSASYAGDALIFRPETSWLPAKKYEVEVSPKVFSSE